MTNESKELYFDRDKLYSEVWSQTIVTLCKRYGISHADFVMACKVLNVPRTHVGYWTQKDLGKAPLPLELPPFVDPPRLLIHPPAVEKRPKPAPVQKIVAKKAESAVEVWMNQSFLPEVKSEGNNELIELEQPPPALAIKSESTVARTPLINKKSQISKWLERIPPKDSILPQIFEEAKKLVDNEMLSEMAITLPATIEKEHPYVKNTRLKLEKIINKSVNNLERGLCKCYGKEMFNVEVAPDSSQRALSILQALCDAFEKRGFDLVSGWDENKKEGDVYVIIMGEKITFSITESLDKVKLEEKNGYGYSKYEYTPTGLLTLKNLSPPAGLECPHWSNDKKKSLLEDKLNNFMATLILASAWRKENEARIRKREEEWKHNEAIRKEKERILKMNKQRAVNFTKATEYWMKYENMSAYFTMVRKAYRKSGKKNVETEKWIQWAREYLAQYKAEFENLTQYEVEEYKERAPDFNLSFNSPPQEPYNYWKRPWYQRR